MSLIERGRRRLKARRKERKACRKIRTRMTETRGRENGGAKRTLDPERLVERHVWGGEGERYYLRSKDAYCTLVLLSPAFRNPSRSLIPLVL